MLKDVIKKLVFIKSWYKFFYINEKINVKIFICILASKERKMSPNKLFIVLIGFVIGVVSSLNITCDKLRGSRIIQIENYIIPVEEKGSFYLYERHQRKVILWEHPAFYFDCKKLPTGTAILNFNNKTIGYTIGHYQNYYPITAITQHKRMHCGHYSLEELVGNRYIVFQHKKFKTTRDFVQKIFVPQQEVLCFIYI